MMSVRVRKANASESSLKTYLCEIGETPLLTAAEEVDLAVRAEAGDAEARQHMIKANLRLVVNIARGFMGRGIELEDLIEEGNLGLLRAARGFDITRGGRFSTYATYWIKQSIRSAIINKSKPIRLPGHIFNRLTKWKRAAGILAQTLQRTPTPKEIGKALSLTEAWISIMAEICNGSTQVISEADAYTDALANMAVDECSSPTEQAEELDLVQIVVDQMLKLRPRDAQVLEWRFGLGGDPPKTRIEIGKLLGVTKERVRQLEKRALANLASKAVADNPRGDILSAWASTKPAPTKKIARKNKDLEVASTTD
jgi:RNA polymerase primary sigma factor